MPPAKKDPASASTLCGAMNGPIPNSHTYNSPARSGLQLPNPVGRMAFVSANLQGWVAALVQGQLSYFQTAGRVFRSAVAAARP